MKVYMGTTSDDNQITYLAGKNCDGDPCIIVTDTWRFRKMCENHKSLHFPFYILQFDEGAITLLQKEPPNDVSNLS